MSELSNFVNNFPVPLRRDVFHAYEPPLVTYNVEGSLYWPDCAVVSHPLGDEENIKIAPIESREKAIKSYGQPLPEPTKEEKLIKLKESLEFSWEFIGCGSSDYHAKNIIRLISKIEEMEKEISNGR